MPRQVNTRRIIRTFYRAWWKRPFWLIAGFIILPVIVGRVALTPVLEKVVRRHLDATKNIAAATFSELDVFLFPPSFTFRDVVVRGPSGETLDVDRLEIHLTSLRELSEPVPRIRTRLVNPHWRVAAAAVASPGTGDLHRWLAALPAALVDLTTVVKGSIGNAALGDGRAVLQGLTGELEGLATGVALVGGTSTSDGGANQGSGRGWQASLDGRLDGIDRLHSIFQVAADGTWQANITVQQLASGGPPTGAGPVVLDVKAKGQGAVARAAVSVSWSGPEAPVALAQDRLVRPSAKWPAANLAVSETRASQIGQPAQAVDQALAGAPAQPRAEQPGVVQPAPPAPPAAPTPPSRQSLDLVVVTASDTKPTATLNPVDAMGMGLQMLRLGNQALLPPPPPPAGVATLGSEEEASPTQQQPALDNPPRGF